MTWTESPAYRLAEWIKAEMPANHVELDDHFDTESVVFYIDAPGVIPAPVLQIGEDMLADHPVTDLVEALKRERVLERLRRDPTLRLALHSSGEVPTHESRTVPCDGRTYRIERDSEHNVRIYDSNDRLLENLPRTILVMPNSVHGRNVTEWQQDIRQWRGPDQ
jgi:hypothetical protein